MHFTIGRLLAAVLLTLCVGLQVLEATGRWDHTIQDAGDEAVIVTVVLCIGTAVGVAAATLQRLGMAPTVRRVHMVDAISPNPSPRPVSVTALCAGPPPLRLRI